LAQQSAVESPPQTEPQPAPAPPAPDQPAPAPETPGQPAPGEHAPGQPVPAPETPGQPVPEAQVPGQPAPEAQDQAVQPAPASQPAADSPPPAEQPPTGPPPSGLDWSSEEFGETEADNDPHHAILVNPLSLVLGAAVGTYIVGVEFQLSLIKYLALDIYPQGGYATDRYFDLPSGAYAAGLLLGPRFSFSGNYLSELFLIPRVGYFYYSGDEWKAGAFGLEGLIGYAWTWGRPGFICHLAGGVRAFMTTQKDLPEGYDMKSTLVSPALDFSLGYGF
jgi:hypothetical protein